MGLDMYLTNEVYVKNWKHMSAKERHIVTVQHEDGSPVKIKPERISNIVEQIGVWRKANHIHNWFVKNVQDGKDDCQSSYVDTEKLEELLEICEKVKADHKLAPELLPTQSGFFFGSTDYDECYFSDIDDTIAIVKDALECDGDIHYKASW